MKKIKLFVIFIFVLAAGAFWLFTKPATINSQTSLTAPTGFTATVNLYNNKVGLYWDTMRGATAYKIFRSNINDPATATDVGATQAPFFFDTTATAGLTFFYWVRSENGVNTSSLSQSAQGMRALATQQGPVPPIEPPPAPLANPLTAAKAALGKAIFWDEQLSSTMTVSCGTCHHAGTGGSDPRSLVNVFNAKNAGFDNVFDTADDVVGSPGVPLSNADGTYSWSNVFGLREQVTGRKANSHINAAYSPLLFWDGRANGTFRDPLTNAIVINAGGALESQAVGPVVNSTEMAHSGRNWADAANRMTTAKPLALASDVPAALQNWIGGRAYPELFQEAFGSPDVTPSRIAMAIASYERTLFSDQTPVDLANAGIQPLPAAEQRGRNTFINVQCGVCHAGNLFSDNTFRNIGLRPAAEDTGRFQVTGNNNNLGQFRVPSLRNVGLRSSFMHNGRLASLEEVVAFYNRGGDFRNEPNFAANLVQPRGLTAGQQTDLVAFLRNSLTDNRVRNELPPFDRPRLYTESTRVPQITGTGRAGTNGIVPQPMAIEPPLVGNPSFTVAVSNALGGAQAVLVIDNVDPGVGATIPVTGSLLRQTTILQGSGAGNGFGSISVAIPNNPALVGQTFFGRWYVADASAANGFSVTPAFRFTIFGEATNAPTLAKRADFDGDGKTDVSVFRPSDGNWYILRSSDNGFTAANFGIATDALAPEDFDGDGKTDLAVFRSGTWFILKSRDGFASVQFGAAGDKPQAGDYDGDGIADAAVFRPSNGTWYLNRSRDGFTGVQFGISSDRPVAADYDGDGKTDLAVFRDGAWYLNHSSAGFTGVQFGVAEDKPVYGDYDADGKTDVAVFRPSTGSWYFLRSNGGTFGAAQFGISTDAPAPGDYDGDGRFDFAVFRDGNWFILQSSNGAFRGLAFGAAQDAAVPSSFVP